MYTCSFINMYAVNLTPTYKCINTKPDSSTNNGRNNVHNYVMWHSIFQLHAQGQSQQARSVTLAYIIWQHSELRAQNLTSTKYDYVVQQEEEGHRYKLTFRQGFTNGQQAEIL